MNMDKVQWYAYKDVLEWSKHENWTPDVGTCLETVSKWYKIIQIRQVFKNLYS